MRTTRKAIAAVNFTYAIPGGMWVRREDGAVEWMTHSAIEDEVGGSQGRRLFGFAYANGMTGMWYDARNGRHCYENGTLVNP